MPTIAETSVPVDSWSHVRRAFYELAAASPIAAEALARIGASRPRSVVARPTSGAPCVRSEAGR